MYVCIIHTYIGAIDKGIKFFALVFSDMETAVLNINPKYIYVHMYFMEITNLYTYT